MNHVRKSRFAHERLDAYRVAVLLEDGVRELLAVLPRGEAELKDQLGRATGAAVRNLVEGANRWSPRDKAARFRIAQGECAECDGCLERVSRSRLASPERVDELRELAHRLGAMLCGLAKGQDKRAESGP